MTKEHARNLSAYLLGQLAQSPPEAFASALTSLLDEQRERPIKLATTDAEIEAAARLAFEESCAKQWPYMNPRSVAAEAAWPVFFVGFKAAFKLYVGSP